VRFARAIITGIILCSPLLVATGAAQREFLTIASTGASSSYYTYWVAVSQALGTSDFNITVLETGGTEDNLDLILSGEADFGQFAEPFNYEIRSGTGVYDDFEPVAELRNLWAITPSVWNWAYNCNEISSLADWDGASVIPGAQGTTIEILAKRIFEALGVTPDYRSGTYADAVSLFKDRQISAFVKAASITAPDAALLDIATSAPLCVYDFSQEEIDTVLEEIPYLVHFDTPDGVYEGIDGYTTWGFVLYATGTSAMSEDTVYRLVREVHENQGAIAEAYKPFGPVDLVQLTLDSSSIPLHSGVVRYFGELGYEVPEDLIPPEYER